MPVLITEVIRRSKQGVTFPFLCRSEGGQHYFVKGSGVGKSGLRAEWLGGCLARTFGLPVPGFDQVIVPEDLIKYSAIEGIGELGTKTAFGSAAVQGAQEITFLQSQAVDLALRAKALLFDWWIQHGDRTLTAKGGNPNLICTGYKAPIISLIDHHSAFDAELNTNDFWMLHVFSNARALWTEAFIAEMTPRLENALDQLPVFWSQLPESWLDDEEGQPDTSALELARITTILARPLTAPQPFWEGVL